MPAHVHAVPSGVQVNASLMVFLEDAAATIRPRVRVGCQRSKIALHCASRSASRSATISEIQQAIAHADGLTDVTISRGVDIYCVASEAAPEAFEWFHGILGEALHGLEAIGVRLHCFGMLSEEQAEIHRWKARMQTFRRFTGGAYLLSSYFQGARLDRRRSYDVLARLAEVFALTGKSRFAPNPCFSVRRETSPFQVYIAGLESYAAPSHAAAAEWLFDSVLWGELQESLPVEAAEWKTHPDTPEHWLLQAASSSSDLAQTVAKLKSFGEREKWIAELALALQVAISNAARERPGAGLLHAFELPVLPDEDAKVRRTARSLARSMFRVFPFPVHPFFLQTVRKSEAGRALAETRAQQCRLLADAIRASFREESLRRHWLWFPPNSSSSTDAANAAAALDARVPGNSVFATCHLDPCLTKDDREDLCSGPERIQFLYLVPVIPI